MIEEIWRPIPGYEGLYEVSNLGRVRSVDRYVKSKGESYWLRKGKMLSPTKDKNGYLKVNLSCNGKHNIIRVHRLVTEAFLPNPDNLPEVNHKDEDKTNNRVENLEWCNRKYNVNFGTARIRSKDTHIKNGYWTGLSKEEYRKKYNQDRKEYRKKWYQENKDRICEQQKEYYYRYYQENRDRICERQKEYYRKKKEEIQNNVKSLNDQD